MPENVRREKRELKYEGSVVDVYKDYMSFENGNTEEWDFIHHQGAAAVLPVLDDGRIVMVTQYRNTVNRITLEIPAGKLDFPGEDTKDCARRELKEETGYSCDDINLLVKLIPSIAILDEKIDIYVARGLKAGEQNLDEDEYVNVKTYTVDELKEMIFAGKLQDSKTIAAILAYESKYLRVEK